MRVSRRDSADMHLTARLFAVVDSLTLCPLAMAARDRGRMGKRANSRRHQDAFEQREHAVSIENDELLVQILGEISALRYVVEILLARDLAAFEPDDAQGESRLALRA